MSDQYTPQEERLLLRLARESITAAVNGGRPTFPTLETLPEALQAPRACFVTLHTRDGMLRGCTGVLAARQPLAHEICQTAVQTALYDPRFMAVQPQEMDDIEIELSLLTPPVELAFDSPEDLLRKLRPNRDGVILAIGAGRATFLPQVWERAPEPEDFLDLLCRKMGQPSGAWRQPGVRVYIYETVIIQEESELAG